MAGISRNFGVYEPLDFLAAVTQHTPSKGEHQIRNYGWYSSKSRGVRPQATGPLVPAPEADTPLMRARRLTWAALIRKVYEVDPLRCPACGGTMRVIAFTENPRQPDVVEKIPRHCGPWKDGLQRAPRPASAAHAEPSPRQTMCDHMLYADQCA